MKHDTRRSLGLLLLLSVLLLAACDLLQGTAATAVATSPSTRVSAAVPTTATIPALTTALPTDAPITPTTTSLIVWLPVDLQPSGNETSALEAHIRAFTETHPDVTLRIEYKTATGPGSILSYLRSGRTVAPDVLPDLVALPGDQLQTAVSESLITPLTDLIDPALLDDLFPAAQTVALNSNAALIGYPFAVTNLTHIAYDSFVITETLPTSWEQFRSSGRSILLPIGAEEGATHVLQLYLENGGELTNEAGSLALDANVLAVALEQLNLARSEGVILRQSTNVSTLQEAWQVYEVNSTDILLTNAETFLRNRADFPEVAGAPMIGLTGVVTPRVRSWAWAISAIEPNQQALAAELLTLLSDADRVGQWSQQLGLPPASRTALAQWPADDLYTIFLQQELERAEPHPLSASSPVMNALGNAAFNVINLTNTPQEAAVEAANAIRP